MPDTQLMPPLSATAATLLLASTVVTAQTPAPEATDTPPPHVQRGNHVEATYKAYVDRLARYRARLLGHLETDAPDLAQRFARRPPPKPVEFGYLIVPNFTLAEPGSPAKPKPAGYTWPWTSEMLDREQTNSPRRSGPSTRLTG